MKLSDVFRNELLSIVGADALEFRDEALRQWTKNTLDSPRSLTGIVKPNSQEQTIALVKACIKHKVPYYPISSGKNWGYGGATPVLNDVLIIDLSGLKRIVEINSELAYVVVEPGVTQQDLYDYLQRHHLPFMVPVTGAGPKASLMGNALERGYGITPQEDHFQSILAIKAILPNGQVYQSALHELGGQKADPVFKWKIGPFLEGLFTQSNLGLVLEITIGLVHQPEDVTLFAVYLNDDKLESSVIAIKKLKQTLGAVLGGINLMNKQRILSMEEEARNSEKSSETPGATKRLTDWVIIGAFYGPQAFVRDALKILKKECRPFAQKLMWINRRRYVWARRLQTVVPLKILKDQLDNVGPWLDYLEGKPTTLPLRLSYLKNNKGHSMEDLNPDRDDCGLLWFSPLVPLTPQVVRDYVQEVTRICQAYERDPLITLTAFTSRCFDSTIPILFSKQIDGDSVKAKACYAELFKACQRRGLFPYRLTIDDADKFFKNSSTPAFWMAQQIKNALDPDHLMAPGRYIYDKRK